MKTIMMMMMMIMLLLVVTKLLMMMLIRMMAMTLMLILMLMMMIPTVFKAKIIVMEVVQMSDIEGPYERHDHIIMIIIL